MYPRVGRSFGRLRDRSEYYQNSDNSKDHEVLKPEADILEPEVLGPEEKPPGMIYPIYLKNKKTPETTSKPQPRVIRGRFDKMSQLIPYPRVGKRGSPFSFKDSRGWGIEEQYLN
ncbi:uncharacterized protein LOC111703500 isoform X2 [Eurytemora carolleeae]|nr:uncharacterized protein LOC111703500 isoform X2 [Eurytemora carolleeae]|eukprot:XP_023331220.1 uncharacterized protein LOC111703500 isoform X2 [Eurytemora affinis]